MRRHSLVSHGIVGNAIFSAIALGSITSVVGTSARRQAASGEAIWDVITPSSTQNFTWTPCYQGLFCARLLLPLDYDDPSGPQAGIALLKQAATNTTNYLGPLLANPGGPGGSGVDILLQDGAALQTIFGGQFDIIGFDPRGVSRSTPEVVIFPDPIQLYAWNLQQSQDPLISAGPAAASRIRARSVMYSTLAQEHAANTAPFVSTGAVARDMLEITQVLGQDKLQYLGISYGTVIGTTFAAMFPDKVGRMILSGVIDANDWVQNRWNSWLVDTDKALETFGAGCAAAGPDLCAIYEATGQKVVARIEALLETLKVSPLGALTNASGTDVYGIVDYRLAKNFIFNFLTTPYNMDVEVAQALAAAERGDGVPLFELSQPALAPTCQCPLAPPLTSDVIAVQDAVICADGGSVPDSPEQLQADYLQLAKVSSFADVLPGRQRCVDWTIQPKSRFTGPFVANTSHPILFVSNTADPVTPLSSAQAMSKGFPGSVVLTQNAAGHTSFSATSLCTLNAISTYATTGVLPPPGTVCQVQDVMFVTNGTNLFPKRDENDAELTDDDLARIDAWGRLRNLILPRSGRFV